MADKKLQYVLDVDPKTGIAGIKAFTSEAEKGFSGAEKKALGLKDAVAAIGIGYMAKQIADFGLASVREFGKAEAGVNQLRRASGEAFAQMSRQAEELSARSGNLFSGGEIKDSISRSIESLGRLGVSADQTFQIVERGADLAAMKSVSLEEAAGALTQAIHGEAGAARRLGVDLSDVHMKTVAYNGALNDSWDKLSEGERAQLRYQEAIRQTESASGAMAAAQDTVNGSMTILSNSFADMQERLGGQLAPEFKSLVNILVNDLIPAAESAAKVLIPLASDAFKFWSQLSVPIKMVADALTTTQDEHYANLVARQKQIKGFLDRGSTPEGYAEQRRVVGPRLDSIRQEMQAEGKLIESELHNIYARFHAVQNEEEQKHRNKWETEAEKHLAKEAERENLLAAQASAAAKKRREKEAAEAENRKKIQDDFYAYGEAMLTNETDRAVAHAARDYDRMVAAGIKKEDALAAYYAKIKEITDKQDAEALEKAKKVAEEKAKIQNDFNEELSRTTETSKNAEITALIERFEFFKKKLGESEKLYEWYIAKLKEIDKKYNKDFATTWQKMIDDLPTSGEIAAGAVRSTFGAVQTELSHFLQTGQMDFAAFSRRILAIWADTAAQIATQKLMVSMTASIGGGVAEGAGAGAAGAGAAGGGITMAGMGMFAAVVAGAVASAIAGREAAKQTGAGRNERAAGLAALGPFGWPGAVATMMEGGQDNSKQTLLGVKDAHKDPFSALRELSKKFAEYFKAGNSEGAGFVLQQIDDINDRFIKNEKISAALKAQFDSLTDASYKAGLAIEQFGAGSKEATAAVAELNQKSTSATLALIAGGQASSEAAQAAAQLALQTNTAATAAQTELDAMSQLADTLFKASENTWALSQASQAAQVAQQMLALSANLTYEEYQKLQEASSRLTEIEAERKRLMEELLTGVDAARFAEIQNQLISLNAEAAGMIGGMTGAASSQQQMAGAMQNTADATNNAALAATSLTDNLKGTENQANMVIGSVDMLTSSLNALPRETTVVVHYIEDHSSGGGGGDGGNPPKNHSGYFPSLKSWERAAIVRKDEDIVPPEKSRAYAAAILSRGMEGDGASSQTRVTVSAPVVINGQAIADAVIPLLIRMSRKGITVVDGNGVGRGLR